MSHVVYNLSIAPLLRTLKNLDEIVSKAEAHVAADEGIDAETLVNARLFPNMLNFIFQIRVATDSAKGVAARLTDSELPSWPDEEETFEDLHERIHKAIDYLTSFEPEQFEGSDTKTIELKVGPYELQYVGADYVAEFVLPNFYFHVTTAYNILRHHGVELGKLDFLGPMPQQG